MMMICCEAYELLLRGMSGCSGYVVLAATVGWMDEDGDVSLEPH